MNDVPAYKTNQDVMTPYGEAAFIGYMDDCISAQVCIKKTHSNKIMLLGELAPLINAGKLHASRRRETPVEDSQ
jgi:hypothetical protein